MKIKLSYILSILFLVYFSFTATEVMAQQEPQYTQYIFNTTSINPAYAGSRESLSLLGLYRNQWVGLDGAPKTLNFSAHTPIGYQGVGLGLGFTSDKIGASSDNIITADFSYTINISRKTQLAFGLKGGISLLDINPDELTIYDPSDYDLAKKNYASPIIGAGVYMYSDNWYLGFSTPNFLETKYYDDVKVSTATEKTHFYLMGGYVFDLSSDVKLKPSVLLKGVMGAPISFDLSANVLLYDRVDFGLAYRLDAAVSAMAGFYIKDNILVGYAYDYSTTELRNYNDGSHEIFLRFEIGSFNSAKLSPRFF